MRILRKRYNDHKASAKQRGIPFLLTYPQWLSIWEASGCLDERGRHKGEYVMARYGDKGGYEVGNVRIITVGENGAEKKPSTKPRPRGYSLSTEHCTKLSAAIRRWHQQHPNSYSKERRALLRETLAKTKQRLKSQLMYS